MAWPIKASKTRCSPRQSIWATHSGSFVVGGEEIGPLMAGLVAPSGVDLVHHIAEAARLERAGQLPQFRATEILCGFNQRQSRRAGLADVLEGCGDAGWQGLAAKSLDGEDDTGDRSGDGVEQRAAGPIRSRNDLAKLMHAERRLPELAGKMLLGRLRSG